MSHVSSGRFSRSKSLPDLQSLLQDPPDAAPTTSTWNGKRVSTSFSSSSFSSVQNSSTLAPPDMRSWICGGSKETAPVALATCSSSSSSSSCAPAPSDGPSPYIQTMKEEIETQIAKTRITLPRFYDARYFMLMMTFLDPLSCDAHSDEGLFLITNLISEIKINDVDSILLRLYSVSKTLNDDHQWAIALLMPILKAGFTSEEREQHHEAVKWLARLIVSNAPRIASVVEEEISSSSSSSSNSDEIEVLEKELALAKHQMRLELRDHLRVCYGPSPFRSESPCVVFAKHDPITLDKRVHIETSIRMALNMLSDRKKVVALTDMGRLDPQIDEMRLNVLIEQSQFTNYSPRFTADYIFSFFIPDREGNVAVPIIPKRLMDTETREMFISWIDMGASINLLCFSIRSYYGEEHPPCAIELIMHLHHSFVAGNAGGVKVLEKLITAQFPSTSSDNLKFAKYIVENANTIFPLVYRASTEKNPA